MESIVREREISIAVDDPVACLQSPLAPLSLFFTDLRTQLEGDLLRIDFHDKPFVIARIHQAQGSTNNKLRSTSAFGLLYVNQTKQEIRMQIIEHLHSKDSSSMSLAKERWKIQSQIEPDCSEAVKQLIQNDEKH